MDAPFDAPETSHVDAAVPMIDGVSSDGSGGPGSVCTRSEDCTVGLFCGYNRGCDAPVGHCVNVAGAGDAIGDPRCGCDNATFITSPGLAGLRPWRYHGSCFNVAPVALGTTANLRDIAGTANGDTYVVGDGGAVFMQRFAAWTAVDVGVSYDLRGAVGLDDQLWIVGGDGSEVLYGNATGWSRLGGLSGGPLYGAGVASGIVWAAGGSSAPATSIAHAFPPGRTLNLTAGAHPLVTVVGERAIDDSGAAYRFNGTELVADGGVVHGAPVDATSGATLVGRAALLTSADEAAMLTSAAGSEHWVLRDVGGFAPLSSATGRVWVGDDGLIVVVVTSAVADVDRVVMHRGHAALRRIGSARTGTVILGDSGTMLQSVY